MLAAAPWADTDDRVSSAVAGAPVLTARRAPALVSRPLARARLAAALERVVATGPVRSCLLVSEDEEVVFEHDADRPLVPASGMKLLTGAAALATMAPAHRVPGPAGSPAAVGDLVERMLRGSDNDIAELLLREVGRVSDGAATVAAGRAGVADALAGAGLPIAGVAVADGSGLDHDNRATCRMLHAVVARASDDSPLVRGLPVAGETGTLAGRFREAPLAGRLRAKTGSIRGVATLVGLVPTPGGGRLTFAYVANDVAGIANGVAGTRAGDDLQDALATVLGRFPDVADPERLAPPGRGR